MTMHCTGLDDNALHWVVGKLTMTKERPLPLKFALALLNNATQLLVILHCKGFRYKIV